MGKRYVVHLIMYIDINYKRNKCTAKSQACIVHCTVTPYPQIAQEMYFRITI